MRIVLIGQAAFGQAVLEALAADPRNHIVGVFAPPSQGHRDDPIAQSAVALSLPLFQFQRLRDAEAIAGFSALEPELCVMAYVTEFVPLAMIQSPARGTIQYHPSLLPRHRGPSSINWPIVMGETETGISIFWPDEGLDTGPLLLQRRVVIEPDDSLGSLYFQKLFPLGVDALAESVDLVRDGRAPRIAQNEREATYEGWFDAKAAAIDWSRSGREIYNLIRGSDPQPGANSTLHGAVVSFFDAAFRPGESQRAAGSIVAVGDRIDIAVRDGSISVGRLRGTQGKQPAAEFADTVGLKPGMRFGS